MNLRCNRPSSSVRLGQKALIAIDLPSNWLRSVDADVAQLVARNLAKVQVAGSTPVVRSLNLSVQEIQ